MHTSVLRALFLGSLCAACAEEVLEAAPGAQPLVVAAHGVSGALTGGGFLAEVGAGHKQLIGVDWELPGGSEQYLCGRVTVPEDVYFSAYFPENPHGTHHTAITVNEVPDAPDGVSECDINEVGPRIVFGSGVGTTGGQMPPGIAMKLARGSQIILNLHLLNVADTPLRGQSGAFVETTSLDKVQTLADGVAVGPLKLTVPPGRSVVSGVCTVDHDYTVFAIMPHMHQTGVHMKVVARRAVGGELVLHEGPYDFENQARYRLEPLALRKGDTVAVECTYENTTPQTLHFGESSHDEMCLAGLARYPAGGNSACPY